MCNIHSSGGKTAFAATKINANGRLSRFRGRGERRMLKGFKPLLMALGAAWLAACGGNGSGIGMLGATTERGTLSINPPFRIASVDQATLLQKLAAAGDLGALLLQLAGNPICGVDVYYMKFWTVGGAG